MHVLLQFIAVTVQMLLVFFLSKYTINLKVEFFEIVNFFVTCQHILLQICLFVWFMFKRKTKKNVYIEKEDRVHFIKVKTFNYKIASAMSTAAINLNYYSKKQSSRNVPELAALNISILVTLRVDVQQNERLIAIIKWQCAIKSSSLMQSYREFAIMYLIFSPWR